MKRLSIGIMSSTFMTAILAGCSVFGIRSGYEQLSYTVIDTMGDAEVRQYPPRVVAEVVDAKDDDEAFMLLFRYISGQNVTSEKVQMTAPVQVDRVQVERAPEKIAMTVPVETSKSDGDKVSMRFFLPRSFTADSAPKPNDPRIKILSVPAETFAVTTYSGSSSEESFRNESSRLMEVLAGTRWRPVSAASFLGYDPPFAIPFLRRNEAIVKVESR